MSQCIVPNWNLRHQKDREVEGEEGNRSYHVDNQRNPNHAVSMSSYEVAELTWENGQLAMHGLGGLLPAAVTKPAWGRTGDTLESIVDQATTHYKQTLDSSSLLQHDHHINVPASNISSNNVAPSGGKWSGSSGHVAVARATGKRRSQSESDRLGGSSKGTSMQEERTLVDPTSACASFCRDNDTTNMTWASFESPQSMKTKTTDEDSAYHGEMENQDEKKDSKGNQTGRSNSKRRSRAADIHNQSERRRRDRINQKMKALQKLVPNANKTDKASMLDEVIEYLKQLQAQVHMMSSVRNNMSQMMMPLGMQQQMQMSLLARMAGMGAGLGMGMGMLDMSPMPCSAPQSLPVPLIRPASVATSNSTFLPSPFMVPQMFQTHTTPPQPNPHAATDASVPFNDAYCTFLAQQSMNMDLFSKMAAVYQQQVDQSTQAMSSPSKPNHVQGD